MSTNPYQQFTARYRVHELAHNEPELTDEELLKHAGWVPHDGNVLDHLEAIDDLDDLRS